MALRAARRVIVPLIGALAIALGWPLRGAAQLPNPDPRALGLGGNFTALARGFSAVAWNPAALGLADQPRITIGLAPVTASAGIGPVSWRALGPFAGDSVPAYERERWLALIEGEGEARGAAGGEVTLVAASFGRFGVQVSTVARADATLTPGASEFVLFGSTGRTGRPCACPWAGSKVDGHAVTTAALSYGHAIGPLLDGQASAGITLKYSVGHALMHGQNAIGSSGPQPVISITFPLVMTDPESDFANLGSGVGVDLGFLLQRSNVTLAASLQNLIQTFGWDEAQLHYREGRVVLSSLTQDADLPDAPFETAPVALRRFVEERTFAPALALGVAHDPRENVTLNGDVRARLGSRGMDPTAGLHIGIGGELHWPWVSLQGGAAARSDGYQLGAGLALSLGPARLGAAIQRRETDDGDELVAMVTLLSAVW